MRGSITIKGETDLFTLAVLTPKKDLDGLSVGDIINLVAAKQKFDNPNQLGLRTDDGFELKRGVLLMFKDNPTLHLFTLKGRPDPKKNLKEIRVFRYKDGGPCMRCEIDEDMIDLSELLFEACINFDISISDYELIQSEEESFDFYLSHH